VINYLYNCIYTKNTKKYNKMSGIKQKKTHQSNRQQKSSNLLQTGAFNYGVFIIKAIRQ
jgi:hypothetical protein